MVSYMAVLSNSSSSSWAPRRSCSFFKTRSLERKGGKEEEGGGGGEERGSGRGRGTARFCGCDCETIPEGREGLVHAETS